MPISKPFSIATEGPTIDGRVISRDWIKQMAEAYSPAVYTAVANLEHYLSSVPDSIFGAYGKVVSLSTREVTIMGEKKMQLMAVVDANDELVSMQEKGKKAFASMEVINNFIGKGITYLGGLAFTDKPASIGTESMKFSVAGAQGERYAFADEIAIEFETAEQQPNPGEGLFTKIKALLTGTKKDSESRFADQSQSIELIAQSQKGLLENYAAIEQQLADLVTTTKASAEAFAKGQEEFAALKETLSKTDGNPTRRPLATGGDGTIETDC